MDRNCLSIDAAFKGVATSDLVSIDFWGKSGPNYYLMDHIGKQMGFMDTVEAVRQLILIHITLMKS
jgi:phage terminase large subunit-like protein